MGANILGEKRKKRWHTGVVRWETWKKSPSQEVEGRGKKKKILNSLAGKQRNKKARGEKSKYSRPSGSNQLRKKQMYGKESQEMRKERK